MKHILPIFEYLKNKLSAKYILNKIKEDISKKYLVSKRSYISNDTLYVFIESPDDKKFLTDKQFRKSLTNKYNYPDKTILCDTFISMADGTVTYTIKDLFFERVVVPQFLYHVCDKKDVDSIMRSGLIPKKNIGSYGTCSYDKPFIFATIDPKSLFHRWEDDGVVIVIDTTKINNKWFKDFNFPYDKNNHVMTQNIIPPIALKKITYKAFAKKYNN